LLDGEVMKWESMTSPSVIITNLHNINLEQVKVEGDFKIKAIVLLIN